jgi:hypothetical protein
MGGSGIEFEEGEADGFAGFGERREGGEEDVPEDFEGSPLTRSTKRASV